MHTYTLAHTPLMPGLCRHSCQAAETLMPLMPGCHSCQAVCEFAVCHSCQALCCHSCQAAETLMPLMPGCHLCQAVCECAVCRHSCQAVCRHSCQAVDTLTLTERLHKLGWDLLPVGGAHRQASPAGRCPESDGPVCVPYQVRVLVQVNSEHHFKYSVLSKPVNGACWPSGPQALRHMRMILANTCARTHTHTHTHAHTCTHT